MRSLLYFSSSSCPPCKYYWATYIKPRVADVFGDKVRYVVDDFNVAKKYHIKETPTMILFDDDKEVERYKGCSIVVVSRIVDFLERDDDKNK